MVDGWMDRHAQIGLAGLDGDCPGAGREQVPARVRARILAIGAEGGSSEVAEYPLLVACWVGTQVRTDDDVPRAGFEPE